MPLPNSYFENFPIEFKKVDVNFSNLKFNDGIHEINPNGFHVDKKVISNTKNRFLNEDLQKLINLDEKETMVINAPVGNGKSYAIIKTIKRFYDDVDNDYLVIVATPFVSLVEQYVKDIEIDGEIPANQIYNYGELGRTKSDYLSKKIQVVTANSLLGNPGEDSYKNSIIKRMYLNDLIEDCEKNNRKVIFIYDEIHDTIPNFKEEFIFNLWKWKNVIHKNFIISATFTEASLIVIEYLAELTDKKILIVEFPREKIKENQSKLFLHYSSAYKFNSETFEITNLIDNLLARDKNIDILCYSKTLAKNLNSSSNIGKKLKEKFGEINDCTSENIDNIRPKNEKPTNRFDNKKCNIGTNFKSGVSIKKENHAFVVILPPRSTRNKFKNYYGIFSSGNTSIIQALARQRSVGEIHIVLPRPNDFNFDTVKHKMTAKQLEIFSENYNLIKNFGVDEDKDIVNYISLLSQPYLISQFYEEELIGNVEKGIQLVAETDRSELARLEFPPLKNFILNESENYLASTYNFFGGDLASYVTYCAFTNQFVNCYLENYHYKSTLFFEEGKVVKELNKFYNNYFGENFEQGVFMYSNFHRSYKEFRSKMFKEFDIRIKLKDGKKFEIVNSYKNSYFEIQLLNFLAYKFHGKKFDKKFQDFIYTRAQYFADCIVSSNSINIEDEPSLDIKERVEAYNNLNYFRIKLISEIKTHDRGSSNFKYLPIKSFPNFIETKDISKFERTIDYFDKSDAFISNNIFNFSRRLKGNFEKTKQSFYKILIEDFFMFENRSIKPRLIIHGVEYSVYPNISVIQLPTENIINIVQEPDYAEGLVSQEFREMVEREYKTMQNYSQKLVEIVSRSQVDLD